MIDTMIAKSLPPIHANISGNELFRLGLAHASRQGTARDLIAAHALLDLAARFGSLEARVYRKNLDLEMDPTDVAESQRLAREWLRDAGASQSHSLKWWRGGPIFAPSA
jgi:TPR repeat protein